MSSRTHRQNIIFLLIYIVYALSFGFFLIYLKEELNFNWVDDLLLILCIPLFYSIFYYKRSLFYCLLAIAYFTCTWVLYVTESITFYNSLTTVSIYAFIITLTREIIYCTLQKRLETQKEFIRREQEYHEIFNATNESIFMLDANDGTIIKSNHTAVNVLGYSKEEFLGQTLDDIIVVPFGSEIESVTADVKQAQEKGPQQFERQFRDEDGHILWGEITLKHAIIGEQDCVLAVVRDISERKKIEKQRDEVIENLKNALEEIETLRDILPLCCHCKKIRNEEGSWEELEEYIHQNLGSAVSHSICPECAKKYYSEYLK